MQLLPAIKLEGVRQTVQCVKAARNTKTKVFLDENFRTELQASARILKRVLARLAIIQDDKNIERFNERIYRSSSPPSNPIAIGMATQKTGGQAL